MGGLLYSTESPPWPDEQFDEDDEEADALDAVLVGIGTRRGRGEGAAVVVVGSTRAMSPLGNLVGTRCRLAPFPLLRMMLLGWTAGTGVGTVVEGCSPPVG